LSLVCCLLSAVSCLLSLVCCLLSAVSCLLSLVSCLLSLVSCLLSLVSCLHCEYHLQVEATSCATAVPVLRAHRAAVLPHLCVCVCVCVHRNRAVSFGSAGNVPNSKPLAEKDRKISRDADTIHPPGHPGTQLFSSQLLPLVWSPTLCQRCWWPQHCSAVLWRGTSSSRGTSRRTFPTATPPCSSTSATKARRRCCGWDNPPAGPSLTFDTRITLPRIRRFLVRKQLLHAGGARHHPFADLCSVMPFTPTSTHPHRRDPNTPTLSRSSSISL
jgi:hypothetical protein